MTTTDDAKDDDANDLEELKKDIKRLRKLEREGKAEKEDKALLAQYLEEKRELEAKLRQGEYS
jgi:hypothetical protein